MNENVIDIYGDFVESKYYLSRYGSLPSHLALVAPLGETKENLKRAYQSIVEDCKTEVVFEKWSMLKHKDDKAHKDYIQYYFLEVPTVAVCIQIEARRDDFEISYLYDRNNNKSFSYVEKSYKKIRELVGTSLTPTFKVLAKSHGQYYVEEINISNVTTNIETNYNDDFSEIDTIIKDALQQEKSGLILLHGKPGTGKTTYIKYLLSIFESKNFIFIPNDFINELLQPNFISFLLTQKNSILVIEDAEKVISSREKVNRDSVVSTILQLTDGLFSDYLNIKVICTFNTHLNNIDEALLRKGRMIAFYEFRELSLDKTNKLLESLNQEKVTDTMTVADIYFKQSKNYNHSKSDIGFKKSK